MGRVLILIDLRMHIAAARRADLARLKTRVIRGENGAEVMMAAVLVPIRSRARLGIVGRIVACLGYIRGILARIVIAGIDVQGPVRLAAGHRQCRQSH